MRRSLIAGNWKMNLDRKSSIELVKTLVEGSKDVNDRDILVCPSYPLLPIVKEVLNGSNIWLGAQNMHFEEEGAFTGEISPLMLKDAGAKYVIIGHSERRNIFGETDQLINKKIKSALNHNIKVVLCVGEKLNDRQSGKTEEVIENELSKDLSGLNNADAENIIIAYEPIWAIGTGVSAKPEQAEEVHKFIRSLLEKMFNKDIGENTTILYGGSVKPSNVELLAKMKNIDGGLVGGASLDCESFYKIGQVLSEIKKL